jgi:L-fuculose-phosphate aldolase
MCSSYGTASVRWRGNDFLITPSRIQRWDLEPNDIVQVKDGMVETGKKASRSVALHFEIYRRNPKINSVILTQSPSLMAFCTTGVKFDVRTIPESWIFLQDVPIFPFASQYDDLDRLADEFKKRPFVMLANDSVVVTGDKLINTFDRLEVADFSARSLILAAPAGKLNPINDKEIEDLRVAFHVGE